MFRRGSDAYLVNTRQSGAALILIMFILGLGIAAYTIKAFNAATAQARQDEETMEALGKAKAALIAWSVAHPNWPGVMPFPDRAETTPPANYDGKSDCVTSSLATTHLLGKLPMLGDAPCITPQHGLGIDAMDATGERLWYAVSVNLIRTNGSASTPIINPGIINSPPNQWLQVFDRNGTLISDRVAAVIIAPGPPLAGQNRSSAAPPPTAFLDSLQIGSASYSNQDYDEHDEDFIMADDSAKLPGSDNTYQRPYNFNDKLVYITIDELMAALEKRVGEQARSSLKTYQDTHGYYPYASQLGTTSNFGGEENLLAGFLPVDYQECTYTRTNAMLTSLSCAQPIFDINNSSDSDTSGIMQVRFTPSTGVPFLTSSPNCTSTFNSCTCTGNGSCSIPLGPLGLVFSCTNNSCTATGIGATGTYSITGGKFTSSTGSCTQATGRPTKTSNCTNSDSLITCGAAMSGGFKSSTDARFDNTLPAWFETNMWQNYVYYQLTKPASSTITIGSKSAEAALVTVGRPILSAPFAVKGSAQTRIDPATQCSELDEYLDSAENVSSNNVYEATSKLRASNYNDQTFIVTP